MKNLLLLSLVLFFISCTSVEGIQKSASCIVWKDQKYLGAYSVEVIEKKSEWRGSCKSYNRDCTEVLVSVDEQNNVLSKTDVLGKIENNELKFTDKHSLTDVLNFVTVRAYPDQKLLKSSIIMNGTATEYTFSYNAKCSTEEAIVGGVAISLIGRAQSKDFQK